jgi:PAS domain S-box-containing protein
MAINVNKYRIKTGWNLFIIFLSLSICILITSLVLSYYQKEYFASEQKEFLSSVSKQKSSEITNWYKENLDNAISVFNNNDLLTGIKKFVKRYDDHILENKLKERIDFLTAESNYKCISILDSNYNILLKSIPDNFNFSKNDLQFLQKAYTSKEIVITEPHKFEYDKNIYFSLIIPIIVREKNNVGKREGAILCLINPNPFFSILMKSLPVPGKTIESFLLKRMGDSLVCLNELRDEENIALTSGLPILLKEMMWNKVLEKKSTIERGIDFREKEVIFYCQEVAGTPWYFIAKVDADGLPESIKISSLYFSILALLSIITLGTGIWFYWKIRTKSQGRQENGSHNTIVNKSEEKEFRENELKYRMLFETMFQGVVYTDNNGVIIAANPAAEKIIGLSLEEMKNLSVDDEIFQAVKYDGSKCEKNDLPIIHAINTGNEVKNDIIGIFNPKQKKQRWIIVNAVPQFENNQKKPYQVYATFEDITERLSSEEQIKNSLLEKELLLKEIHHRVKNNLQIIISLLNLNEEFLEDEKSHDIFTDIQTRVRSMALIHELMYKQENFIALNIKDYIENMIKFLCNTYSEVQDRITVVCNVENIQLDMDTLIPCGLIVNELFTNSLKHAFPNGSKGSIYINFKAENDKYILSISDDGVGIPKEFDVHGLKTFGLKLVDINTRQLRGEMNVTRKEKGVEFKMEFERLSDEQ